MANSTLHWLANPWRYITSYGTFWSPKVLAGGGLEVGWWAGSWLAPGRPGGVNAAPPEMFGGISERNLAAKP